jgi:hypothetical protein
VYYIRHVHEVVEVGMSDEDEVTAFDFLRYKLVIGSNTSEP